MEVFVRGARSSRREWEQAHNAPLSEIPPLSDSQKAEARRGNISEEELARITYAEHIWQQREAQKILRFGAWLNEKVEERNSEYRIDAIELDTLAGKFQIAAQTDQGVIEFEMDEDLVDRFMATGSGELESAILRVLDVNLPKGWVAKAS